ATGQIGQPDTFSYTIAGKELPDHEWLYEVLLALVWKGAGDGGLKFVRVCLYIAPLLILARQLRQRGVPDYSAGCFLLLAGFTLFWFERLRPLVCTTICLQLVSGWLYDQSRGRRPLDWKLPVTTLLWGNLHPAVIMGQFLIGGAIILELARYWCGWKDADERVPRKPGTTIENLTLWGMIALAASMICPAPINRFLYPFSPELRHPIQRMFVEIMPTWQFLWHNRGMQTALAWMVVVLAIIFTALMLRRYWHFRAWEWALYICLLGLAVTAVRAIGDWLLVSMALIVPQLGRWLRETVQSRQRGPFFPVLVQLDRQMKSVGSGALFRPQWQWPVLSMTVLLLLALVVPPHLLPNRQYEETPRATVDWIQGDPLPSSPPWKIFTGSNEGSYLNWRLDGRARVYTDTRGFYYPGELLEDSFYLPREEAEYNVRLQRVLAYGTQYFLLPMDDADGVEFQFWKSLKPYCSTPLYMDDLTGPGPHYVLLTRAQVIEGVQNRSANTSEKHR
ncbi:MAG TPA: hypothetical protein VKS79_08320, partial [Gemmataceae bacterium]|nr:hypothetical protein [Gemmataceae bacterium]